MCFSLFFPLGLVVCRFCRFLYHEEQVERATEHTVNNLSFRFTGGQVYRENNSRLEKISWFFPYPKYQEIVRVDFWALKLHKTHARGAVPRHCRQLVQLNNMLVVGSKSFYGPCRSLRQNLRTHAHTCATQTSHLTVKVSIPINKELWFITVVLVEPIRFKGPFFGKSEREKEIERTISLNLASVREHSFTEHASSQFKKSEIYVQKHYASHWFTLNSRTTPFQQHQTRSFRPATDVRM